MSIWNQINFLKCVGVTGIFSAHPPVCSSIAPICKKLCNFTIKYSAISELILTLSNPTHPMCCQFLLDFSCSSCNTSWQCYSIPSVQYNQTYAQVQRPQTQMVPECGCLDIFHLRKLYCIVMDLVNLLCMFYI